MRGTKAKGASLPAIGWSALGGKPDKSLRRSLKTVTSAAGISRTDTILELIAELRVHFDKVREKAEFLKLKESELRPDDEISLFGMMDAKQECYIEQSLLSGHAFMVQQVVQKKRVKLDHDSQRLLDSIRKFSACCASSFF